jgi:hypothetical protein
VSGALFIRAPRRVESRRCAILQLHVISCLQVAGHLTSFSCAGLFLLPWALHWEKGSHDEFEKESMLA